MAVIEMSAGVGGAVAWQPFVVLLAWTLGAVTLAARTFRWEWAPVSAPDGRMEP